MIDHFPDDTIAAIATPFGEGGIGVIRLSGRQAVAIADQIFESKKKLPVRLQESHTVQYGHVLTKDAQGRRRIIDEVLLLLMKAPKSYTREDVVEISAHSGAAILQAILELAVEKGARLAEKGEFTKRAFLNGRIDLMQAEAVLDLIQARTPLTRDWASAQLGGALSHRMASIKNELLEIAGHLEASIDFPDDHTEADSLSVLEKKLAALSENLEKLLVSARFGVLAKQGIKAVLSGRPNVGKSSLMNALSRSDRVIVTPFPGTTRDVIEQEIQIHGIPVRLFDTAGIQETQHPIEKEGIGRSKSAVQDSDLVLYVVDASVGSNDDDARLLEGLGEKKRIIILNKADLPHKTDKQAMLNRFPETDIVFSSCVENEGTKELEESIFRIIFQGALQVCDEIVISSVRQKELLEKTLKSIESARQGCRDRLSGELVAVDVRLALNCIGSLAGEVLTDDILDVLFARFCIGK